MPHGYGLAWVDVDRRVLVCLPIPFNWLAAQVRKLYWRVMLGPKINPTPEGVDTEFLSQEYQLGYRAGRKAENARWQRVFDDFLAERERRRGCQ